MKGLVLAIFPRLEYLNGKYKSILDAAVLYQHNPSAKNFVTLTQNITEYNSEKYWFQTRLRYDDFGNFDKFLK